MLVAQYRQQRAVREVWIPYVNEGVYGIRDRRQGAQVTVKAPPSLADAVIAETMAILSLKPTDPFSVYPKDAEALSSWIEEATGKHIPAKGVCPGHDAPMQFVWDFFAYEVNDALALANRSGGKTFDIAALHLANNHHKDGFEVAHIGAIQIQAKRCYAYYRAGLRHEKLRLRAPDPHITETDWVNMSKLEIMPGTEAQTQGGHPAFVTYDELEQGKRQPYENAKSMPEEWRYNGRRHLGQFLATSTRQSSLGLMQRALDEAEESGTRIYEWCVFETMEPCDGQEGRAECNAEECPLWQWCGPCDGQKDKTNNVVLSHGRAVHADGWRSREQVTQVFNRVGIDTWEAQHLCIKPDAKALIYAPFSRESVKECGYVEGAGALWLGYDWGFTDPTHIGFVQQRDGAFYQFDELVGSNRSERDWVREVVRRVVALEGYDGPTLEGLPEAKEGEKPRVAWEDIWAGKEPWPSPWPGVWPEAVGDPSAVQMRHELKEHGIGAAPPKKVKHEVEAGQDVLRAAILSGSDLRRLFIHPRCVVTIRHLSNYRARELDDGSFDPRPDPDPANHAFSHGCDALRYLMWRLRKSLGIIGGNDGE